MDHGTNGRAYRRCARARRCRGAGSRFSAGEWRDRCVGREGRKLSPLAVPVVAVFDPLRQVVPAKPESARERKWPVGSHAARHASSAAADRKCNGLMLRTHTGAPAPSHSRYARVERVGLAAEAWQSGPCHHSTERSLTSRRGKPRRDAQRQEPARRRARPRGRSGCAWTVPFVSDATQPSHSTPPGHAQRNRDALPRSDTPGRETDDPRSPQDALGSPKNRYLMEAAARRISVP